jgi:ecdysone receptor
MKEECLLSERQCVARNARRQTKPKPPHSKPQHRGGVISAKGMIVVKRSMSPVDMIIDDRQSPVCRTPLDMLSDEHRDLVTRIVGYQDKYDLPSPEDVARVAEMNIAKSFVVSSASDAIFGHMVEMTILVTRLVVEFAKHLPGFQNLAKDDQIALLKGSASEVMMLRTARRYDPETNTVVFGDGTPFSSTSMAFGGLQGFVDGMFDFSRGMATLAVDNAEYALLTALCIFSDRPNVKDMSAIQHIQEVYSEALHAYVKKRRICGSHFLAKLLMKLVELRTLSDEHSKCLYRLTIEKGSLPPLLREYFDIPDHQ